MKRFNVVRPLYAIIASFYFGILVPILPVVFIFNGLVTAGATCLLLWAVIVFFAVIHNCYINRIEISSKGVNYITLFKRYSLKWTEISIIGVGYVPIKKLGTKPWIYFSANNVPVVSLTANMVNERFFMMNYRESVIEVIKQYWPYDIIGLDNLK